MTFKLRTAPVTPKDEKPKGLKVSLVLDVETTNELNERAMREGVPLPDMLRTLIVGSLSAYPSWGIKAQDRRRAFNEQKHAILVNLYAWFNEQRWIMEQQIKEESDQ